MAEFEEGLVQVGATVIAGAEAAELMQPSIRTFPNPAETAEAVNFPGASTSDLRLDAQPAEQLACRLTVVCCVGHQPAARTTDSSTDWRHLDHQGNDLPIVVRLGRGERSRQGDALAVGNKVPLFLTLTNVHTLLCTAVTTFWLSWFAFHNADANDLATVGTAWQTRQDRARALQVTWEEDWVTRVFPPRAQASRSLGQEVSHHAAELSLYLSEDKARFETYTIWFETKELVRSIHVFNFTDAQSRELLLTPNFPSGIIRQPTSAFFSSQMSVLPLLLAYRGCDQRMCSFTLSKFKIAEDDRGIQTEGKPVLFYRDATAQAEWYLVLEPELDYVPVQLVGFSAEKRTFELKMNFARSTAGDVVPEFWAGALFDKVGRVINAARAKVHTFVEKEPLDDKLFDLVFPDGTMVDDIRLTPAGMQHHRQFVVVNGKERTVLREELIRGAEYEELLRTETGKAALVLPERRSSLLFALNMGVVLFLAVIIFVIRFRKFRTTSQALKSGG